MEKKTHSLKAWFFATRPWSFPASAMPITVALAYLFWQGVPVDWAVGIWTLVNVVLFHAAANCWSDYFDYKKGVDRDDTIGGVSITSGEFKASEIKALAMGLLAVSVLSGIALLLCTGLPTLYLGLAGCLLIVLYPWLKYHALGDVDIFLTFSLLPILGTSYVATGCFHTSVLWLTLPIGLITVGILHVNNSRDIEHDGRAGIHTFAMLIGAKASAVVYCIEVLLPFVWVAVAAAVGIFPWWSLLVLVALKPAADNASAAMRFPAEGIEALRGVDEKTAQLQLIFSLLFTVSFFVDKLL